MRLATFLYQTERDHGECNCWPLEVGKEGKSPGATATALERGQADSPTGKTVGKTAPASSHPQVPTIPWASGTVGRTAKGRGQT